MNNGLALERRLMRSMTPATGKPEEVDLLITSLLEDPGSAGAKMLEMVTRFQHSIAGNPFEAAIRNAFFAGIAVKFALDLSESFQESVTSWLNQDDESGRLKVVNFKEMKARMGK